MGAKEQQLNESLEQQAELAAVVLTAGSTDRGNRSHNRVLSRRTVTDAAALEGDLRAATARRPHWI